MLETSRFCLLVCAVLLAACATPVVEAPKPAPAVVAAPPQPPPAPPQPDRKAAQLEEAKAMLAQAETDVQRARAKRALWQKAWEDLVASRQAVAAGDAPRAIRLARRASELAQLGLEQLAYPAVR
ncbi:MAG TPA: hypothetical protein VM122_07425 [Usitatibacter sp.]|nr:hypothetical protein [Usitatibacter sp.]